MRAKRALASGRVLISVVSRPSSTETTVGTSLRARKIEENANHEGGHDGRDVPFNWCNEGGPGEDTGGNHLSDNSGVIAYVRILEAGRSGR